MVSLDKFDEYFLAGRLSVKTWILGAVFEFVLKNGPELGDSALTSR